MSNWKDHVYHDTHSPQRCGGYKDSLNPCYCYGGDILCGCPVTKAKLELEAIKTEDKARKAGRLE